MKTAAFVLAAVAFAIAAVLFGVGDHVKDATVIAYLGLAVFSAAHILPER